jgi:type II secretory pathway component GspD/PulD (secretin)
MKNVISKTLSVICVAGLLSSASAQNNPPDNAPAAPPDNAPAASDQAPGNGPADAPAPPPDMNGAAPNDNGPAAANDNAPAADDNTPAAPDNAPAAADNAPAVAGDDQPAAPAKPAVAVPSGPEDRPAAALSAASSSPDNFMPPTAPGTNLDQLTFNFVKAPLVEVLNYLSDAAGFIIVLDTKVSGNVSIISKHSITRDEAVVLLNDVLNKNGLAAIRNDRELTIVDKDAAKTEGIPVRTGYDPTDIPDNAEIATWIIPVRFVEAGQLTRDLASFVSSDATIVANDAGNSIVITDTQSNIRHLVEIIKAVDSSAEGETQIKVYHMDHANPTDVASELAAIFPSNGGSGGGSTPIRFNGGGGGRGGGGGFLARMLGAGGGGGGGDNSNARVQKQSQVLAVPDLRTSSVIVTASKDLIVEIDGMMAQLDVPSTRDQDVYTVHLKTGDTMEDLQVLQSMFGGNNSRSSSTPGSALQTRETSNSSSSGMGSSSSTGIGSTTGGGGGGRGGF